MAAQQLTKGVSGARAIRFSLTLFYPVTMAASIWWSLRGAGDKEYVHKFTFKKLPKHIKLDSNEYAALPSEVQQHREQIVKEFINIYKCEPTFDAERCCHQSIVFEDPVVKISGLAAIASIIWGLPKITRNAEVTNVEVEQYDQAVKLKFDYLWETRLFSVSSPVQLYLTLDDEEQKTVISCKDMWNGREFWECFGFVTLFKTINGYAARAVMGTSTGRLFR